MPETTWSLNQTEHGKHPALRALVGFSAVCPDPRMQGEQVTRTVHNMRFVTQHTLPESGYNLPFHVNKNRFESVSVTPEF